MKIEKIRPGVWPTMITPYTPDGKPDFKAIPKICEWYIQNGCDGIFAVCQSSEMAFLTEQEKLDIAQCVVDSVGGRISVVASGHTASDKAEQFKEIEAMSKLDIQAYVLVSNRLDQAGDDEAAFVANTNEILQRFPELKFGIYECPIPFKRLISTEFFTQAAKSGQIVFVKDTCCDHDLIRERLKAIAGSELMLFNANAATFYDSITHGAAGYSGVMANFHPYLFKYVIEHFETHPTKAKLIADLITEFAMIEMRIYPVSAKYHMNLEGIPMELIARSADAKKLDKNARLEVESLYELEQYIKEYVL